MNLIDIHNPHFYITTFISILNATIICFNGYKFFQTLQLEGYNISGYFYWIKDTKAKYVLRLFTLSFLTSGFLFISNFLFYKIFNGFSYYSYITLIFYFYLSIKFALSINVLNKKTPLKYTKRMMRFITTFFILTSVITFYLITLFWEFSNFFNFSVVSFTPILNSIFIIVVHFLLLPLEEIIKLFFILKAKIKLKKHKNLIKIGITGSFGKTSTKYILNTILSQKYKVCMSPNSYNTPMGLTKVVNEYLKNEHEVLIAEMGAKKRGEIAFLCKLIKPQHGILTGIGNQHLKTFGSALNIKKTKYELIENLNKEGVAIFNGNNDIVKSLYENSSFIKKYYTALNDENAFISANNIKVNENGSSFNIVIKNEISFFVKTVLLGVHNIENILLSVALSYKLGLTKEQIKLGIEKIKSVPHRLELVKAQNGVIILDDSFNASVEGSSRALDVLKLFENRRKIVMTPGLIELGEKEYEENVLFGERIAKVADICILVNLVNKKLLKEGLLKAGFLEQNIIECDSLKEAKEKLTTLLNKDDVLLIENDLPDVYT